MTSVPVVDKAKRELLLRGVKYYLDLEPEKSRELSLQKLGTPFCLHDLVNHLGLSLVGTLMAVLLGAFHTTFSSPTQLENNL